MVSCRVNRRAGNNRDMLIANAARAPTARQTRRRQSALTRHNNAAQLIRAMEGREARRTFQAEYHSDLQVLSRAVAPSKRQALRILYKLIDNEMPDGLYGYSHDEIIDIAPIILLVIQIEGRAKYYVLTKVEVGQFLIRLGANGWNGNHFPSQTGSLAKTPFNTKIRYGVCKIDLPPSEATKLKWAADQKRTLGRGEPWVDPVWHQPKIERKQGAPIFLHMNHRLIMPSFDMKDAKGASVAERDVLPDRDDEDVFIRIIIARDTQEHDNTITNNARILVRAAQYRIWASRNPNNITPAHAETARRFHES